jgi:hypothetical protein
MVPVTVHRACYDQKKIGDGVKADHSHPAPQLAPKYLALTRMPVRDHRALRCPGSPDLPQTGYQSRQLSARPLTSNACAVWL